MKKIFFSIALFCFLANPCLGETDTRLTIGGTEVEPAVINSSGRVAISCQLRRLG